MEKPSHEFILLIMNCQKYKNKALRQKQTWLPFLPPYIYYLHVVGDPNLEEPYKLIESDQLLIIKTEDDYNHLPKKVINAYKIINDLFNYKFIYKTDDDQMLQTSKFFPFVSVSLQKNSNVHYGGMMVTLNEDTISDYYNFHPELPRDLLLKKGCYCNGRFYLLSQLAVEALIKSKSHIESEYFEDYSIGHYLPSQFKINYLSLNTNLYFKDMAN